MAEHLIPPCVRRLWPEESTDAWQWLSPTRLRAPHAQVPGVVWLVVLDHDHTTSYGRPLPATAPEQDIRTTYAQLRALLTRHATRELNCQDGTPELRPDQRCAWCATPADQHPGAGERR